jgi:hypothetical protein
MFFIFRLFPNDKVFALGQTTLSSSRDYPNMKPALPIHTDTECKLCKMLMSEDPSLNNANGPLWKLTIKVWSRISKNDPEITYKLAKQLIAYYKDWKAILNIKQIFLLTIENQKVAHDLIRNPQCSLQMTAAPQQQMQPHGV